MRPLDGSLFYQRSGYAPSKSLKGDINLRAYNPIDEVKIWNAARTPAQIGVDLQTNDQRSEAGLVAWYNFEQLGGVWFTNLASPLLSGFGAGKLGNAYAGQTNYNGRLSNAGEFMASDEVTVEYWINLSSGSSGPAFVTSPDTSTNRFTGGIDASGRLYWALGDTNAGGFLQSAVQSGFAGAYHHVALVGSKSQNAMRIILDGVLLTNRTGFSGFRNIEVFDLELKKYAGAIDDFRIWNRARTTSEIAADRNRALTGSELGLVVYLPLDETSEFAETTLNLAASPLAMVPATASGAGLTYTTQRSAAPAGLIAQWPGESPTASDVVGSNPGQLVGGTTFAEGKVNKAFSFDGVDDRVSIPESSSLDLSAKPRWTIVAWIKPAKLTGQNWPTIYSEGRWMLSFGLENGTGKLESFINNDNAKRAVSTTAVKTNEWSHVALVYDGTLRTFYINGQASGTGAAYAIPNDNSGSAIGDVTFTFNSSRFNGLIDEVALYDRALLPAEIQTLYGAKIPAGDAFFSTLDWRNSAAPFGTILADEETATPVYLSGFDPEPNPINPTFSIVLPPAHGTLASVNGRINSPSDNPIIYTPDPGYNGPDYFTYKIDNGTTDSSVATVHIQVRNVNDSPVVMLPANYIQDEEESAQPIPITISDEESPIGQLTIRADSSDQKLVPNNGIVISGSGTNRVLTITPVEGELGRCTITIAVSDPDGAKTVASMEYMVNRSQYGVIDLGTLPQRTASFATAMNEDGWGGGYSQNSTNDTHAFVFRGLQSEVRLDDLGTLGGPTSSALGINNNNDIVGSAANAANRQLPFVWTTENPIATALPLFSGGTTARAFGLNDARTVVGQGAISLTASKAFAWNSGDAGLTDLVSIGGTNSAATAINSLGRIVGYTLLPGNQQVRAFVGSARSITNLGTLPGHQQSRAWGVSELDHVVGESISNGVSTAFLYRNGLMQSLGKLTPAGSSVAYGINDFGQAVGSATDAQSRSRAVFYTSGVALDLNALIPADSGWVLTEARDINNSGLIAATGSLNDGRPHAVLAVPATPIGRPVARPEGALTQYPPEVEIIKGNPEDTGVNSFFWVPLEGRLYATRPVTARLRWRASAVVTNESRIVSLTVNVWPKRPTIYVVNSPVEVEPRGVPFQHKFQSVLYSVGGSASVDPSSATFRSADRGWSVLYYLRNEGQEADVNVHHPYFEVIKRVPWNDPDYFSDNIPWTIGQEIVNPRHTDYFKKNGYVLFSKAPYDAVGDDKAYDRNTRLGPILPVNLPGATADHNPTIVWYHTNKIGVAWANEPIRYALSWPTDAPHLVIASGLGSGLLDDALFANKRVYHQPDPTQLGYNPNEEHALLAPSQGGTGDALFALRNDLNKVVGVSEPFALLKYRDPRADQWRIKIFQVVAEESPYFFFYSGEAGKEISPPYPMSILPLKAESYGVSGPFWEDVRGKLYGRAAGTFGDHAVITLRFFYPLQPGFFYDLNKDGAADLPLNAAVPLLDRRPGGVLGTPIDIRYDIRWPDNPPVLQVGETLLNPKRGLPGVRRMAKAEIVYADVENSVLLFDPLSERKIQLGPADKIPDRIKRQNISGKEIFSDLIFPIRVRLKYDPTNRQLIFSGYIDESGVGSNPLLLPNMLSSSERETLKALAPGDAIWSQIVERLYSEARKPLGPVGDSPKGLSAGFANVPPATPRPGLALRLNGTGRLTIPTVTDLRDFTLGMWAKVDALTTGYLFTDTTGGRALSLKPEAGAGRIIVSEGGVTFPAIGYTFDTGWHFFALVRDTTAGKILLYVDGRQVGDAMSTAGLPFNGDLIVGQGFVGDLDEVQIWTAARGGNAIRARMDRALNGAEDGLFAYYRFDDDQRPYADLTAHRLNGEATNAPMVASGAPAGIPPRFVVLSENNDLSLGALPISLKVIRVEDGPYAGDLKVIYPDNVFDERLTFRHSNDFAGDPDQVEFEWYYKPDAADFDPTDLPEVSASGQVGNTKGWIRYSKSGQGVNQITIGEGGESSLLTLGDNWFICRFRGYAIGRRSALEWSDWVGDPASIGIPRATLGEGWVKRVVRGLNPFDARVKDFHSSPVNTFASMLVQAGQRYEGDIAFNPSAENLNSIGLIEAYSTVINRGRSLSIDGIPAVNFPPANNALLLAASRIADLYTLLGNEARADAEDPTIGFSTASGQYGSLASSIFAFQNQLDSLLEEELVLLRGRDDSAAGVQGAPVYNRLFWNFTLGEGEVAYQQTYNISDQTKDGFIDEKDARVLYPQGHGDAWGHYLTALTTYYQLLRHTNFTWVARAENVLVGGTAVQVDFLDERKFATAAGLKAKTGAETMNLTYRLHYVDDPAGQWQGYKDTKPDRA